MRSDQYQPEPIDVPPLYVCPPCTTEICLYASSIKTLAPRSARSRGLTRSMVSSALIADVLSTAVTDSFTIIAPIFNASR